MALMAALRRGVNPDSTHYVSKSPTYINDTLYGKFEIKTYGGVGAGNLSLRQATLKSDNSVYIQLAMDLGPDEVKRTARDMGITSTLKGYPSETLGGLEDGVSPLEMATAYASIASGGYRLRPTAITKIKFPDGRVEEGKELPARFRVKRVRIFDDGVAAEAREILEQNITGGTGTHAIIGCPAAGKTGTTDNNTDAWFVGFTPRHTTAVWVGYPNERIYMNGLYFGRNVDGGTFPADIWGDYMGRIKGDFCGDFKPPETPFSSSPFYGRYSKSGGSLTGGEVGETDDPTSPVPVPAPTAPDSDEPDPGADGDEDSDGGNGPFDPTQYESAPQEPPDIEPPPDPGADGGVEAPG
jgi:penicillin-binding protein 1A